MPSMQRILREIVKPDRRTYIPGVKPGNYIAYWEAFPAVIPDSGSLYARLAIGTTDELANLAIPVRNNNVFERSRSELWIRMVARVMAINWDSRVKCDLVSLLVLGPLALMPFRAEFLRSLKQIKNVYPLEWMRDWLQANTASKSRGAIDWAHLETVGYLLNRSTSKHLTKAQREDWVQLHHALGRYADPVYGTNSSDLRLMTVKRSRLTSAVIINSASLFPKIPMSSWILCRSRLPDARHSTLLWACVRKVDRLTRKLTVTVRSDVKARGYGGYSTNGELGLEPVDERELSAIKIDISDVRALVSARGAEAVQIKYRHRLGTPTRPPPTIRFPSLRNWDYIVYQRSRRGPLLSAWVYDCSPPRGAKADPDTIIVQRDYAETDAPDDHRNARPGEEREMISRHQIVDLVELASANFDRLRPHDIVYVVHRGRHGRLTVRQASMGTRADELANTVTALWPRQMPSLRSQIGNYRYLLHFDGISLPPQWYSRQHIFTFEKDAQVRLERSLGYLNEQRWCERLLDVRRKHGTKSNSSSRSSSPGARPSNRRPPGPGPGPNGLGSQPAVRSNPPSQTRTGYVTPPTQRARSHSMPAPPPRRPPIRRNTSSNLKTIYPPDQYIHVTEDPE